jgi:hypothetical protein
VITCSEFWHIVKMFERIGRNFRLRLQGGSRIDNTRIVLWVCIRPLVRIRDTTKSLPVMIDDGAGLGHDGMAIRTGYLPHQVA